MEGDKDPTVGEEHVTQNELEERLNSLKLELGERNFWHHAGKTLHTLGNLVSNLAAVAVVGGILVYGAMTFAYGPYDTGKVIYAELSGNKNLKHKHMEKAKALYARKIRKSELDENDVRNLYSELWVVPSPDNTLDEDDVSWYNLLDWIEDNN